MLTSIDVKLVSSFACFSISLADILQIAHVSRRVVFFLFFLCCEAVSRLFFSFFFFKRLKCSAILSSLARAS